MVGQGSQWTWGNVVSTVVGAVTLVASFFLTGEDALPGAFYVQRQAFWNGGTYGVKLTFMLTWFTLMAAVALPVVCVLGGVRLVCRLLAPATPSPEGWDLQQIGRRVGMAATAIALLLLWTVVTAVVAFMPDWLSPLGGFASILLLIVPALPLVPALLFEALIPPRFVDGAIEGMRYTTYKDRTTLHLHVAGRRYTMPPSATEGLGLGQGMRVRLIASGFFERVLRITRWD